MEVKWFLSHLMCALKKVLKLELSWREDWRPVTTVAGVQVRAGA